MLRMQPNTPTNKDLAELLVRCRAEKGLTIGDVAKSVRISPMTISNIESGKKHMRRTTRVLLEDFLRKHGYLPKREKVA